MSEIKDWRGTPIEVGRKVLIHANNGARTIGVVKSISKGGYWGDIRVNVANIEHSNKPTRENAWYGSKWENSSVLVHSVTVLTKDMFDDSESQ